MGRKREGERKKGKEGGWRFFHPLLHSTHAHSSCGWASPEPGARGTGPPCGCTGPKTGAIPYCLHRHIRWELGQKRSSRHASLTVRHGLPHSTTALPPSALLQLSSFWVNLKTSQMQTQLLFPVYHSVIFLKDRAYWKYLKKRGLRIIVLVAFYFSWGAI